jgi:hypothetical protein
MKQLGLTFLVILSLFRVGRLISYLTPRQEINNIYSSNESSQNNADYKMYHEEYGTYESRYAQWEKKYGKQYLESLNEEDRAVFLKDVNCLKGTTSEILPFSAPSSWKNIINDNFTISYPKDWLATVDTQSKVSIYKFKPLNKQDKSDSFYAELIPISGLKQLMNEKGKLFPSIANTWWQNKAENGCNIRSISRVKFLDFDTYKASGQLTVGDTRETITLYLIDTPQDVYQFKMVGAPATIMQYAKTATNIIQTFKPVRNSTLAL